MRQRGGKRKTCLPGVFHRIEIFFRPSRLLAAELSAAHGKSAQETVFVPRQRIQRREMNAPQVRKVLDARIYNCCVCAAASSAGNPWRDSDQSSTWSQPPIQFLLTVQIEPDAPVPSLFIEDGGPPLRGLSGLTAGLAGRTPGGNARRSLLAFAHISFRAAVAPLTCKVEHRFAYPRPAACHPGPFQLALH